MTSRIQQTAIIQFNPNGKDPLDKYLGKYCRETGRIVDLVIQGNDIHSNPNLDNIKMLAAKVFDLAFKLKDLPAASDQPTRVFATLDDLLTLVPTDLTGYLFFTMGYQQIQEKIGLSVTIRIAEKSAEEKTV